MRHFYLNKMWYRQLLIGFLPLFLVGIQRAGAQGAPAGGGSGLKSTAGTIIPPAPKTASLGKFGQLPVELNTGAVAVSVPILDVQSGPLHLPIALSFNTTGSKVSDGGSWVGQGWNLSSGGVITRTVRGQPDETVNTGYQAVWPTWRRADSLAAANVKGATTRLHQLQWRANALNWDLEADTYTISIPGLSAALTLDAYGRARLNPANGWQVLSGGPTGGWLLAAPDGTRYEFGAFETSTTEDAGGIQHSFIAAWHLTTIESADGHDHITFSYIEDGPAIQVPLTQSYQLKFTPYGVRVSDSPSGADVCETCFRDPPSTGAVGLNYQAITPVWLQTVSLREIRSATQRVVFCSDSLTTPNLRPGQFPTEPPSRLLRRIVLLPLAGTSSAARTFRFTFVGDTPTTPPDHSILVRHYLTAVQDGRLPPTRFTYYATDLPGRHSLAQDHWGYYNGAGNSTLVPQLPTSWRHLVPGGARRATNARFLLQGALRTITYPTGGGTTFFYEANQALAPASFDADEPTLGENRLEFRASVTGNNTLDSLSQHVFDLLYGPNGSNPNNSNGVGTPFVNAILMDLPAGARALNWQPYEHNFSPHYVPPADLRLMRLDTTAADPVATALAAFPVASEPYYSSVSGQPTPLELPPGRYVLLAVAFDASYRADLAVNLLPRQALAANQSLVARTVGGLRIRRMADVAGMGTDSLVTTYDYTAPDPITGQRVTTGILFDVPTYLQSTPCGAVVISAHDNSLLPKNEQGSFHLGYGRVQTTRQSVSTGGTTVTTFLNVPSPYFGKLVTAETVADGGGRVLQETHHEYTAFDSPLEEVRSTKLSVFSYHQVKSIDVNCGWITLDTLFNSINYSASTVQRALTRTQQRHYEAASQGQRFQDQTTLNGYFPDLAGRFRPQPSEIATIRASGDTLVVWRRYAADYDTTGTAATSDPVARGIAGLLARSATAAVVEERTGYGRAVGRLWVSGSVTEYTDQHPRRNWKLETQTPLPTAALPPTGITSGRWHQPAGYRPEQEFDRYSAQGRLLQMHPITGVPTSFLWGNDRPIAQATNMAYGSGAYTSFEAGATGRWQYDSLGTHSVATHFTGTVGYQLDGTPAAAIRCSGLHAGAYELWFWTYGSMVPQISGTTQQQDELLAVAGLWHQHRVRLTLPARATLQLNSAPNQRIGIDELRLAPVDAQMSTYTYDPLVGITSQTDPTGRTTTYEYDSQGRLVRTRDEQGRVLSQQQYHYAQP